MPPRTAAPHVIVRKTFEEAYIRGMDDVVAFAEDFLDTELHEGQIEWCRKAQNHRERMLSAAKRYGKALALDTPILTRRGWSRMGDLKVGDELYDENIRYCRVTWVGPIYTDHAVYDVAFSDGSAIAADAGHLWTTTDRAGVRATRTTEEVRDSLLDSSGELNHELPSIPLPCAGRRYVSGVWSVESCPVRCIAVDSPSRLFLAGRSFIPTHNSQVEAIRLLHACFYQIRPEEYSYLPNGQLKPYRVVNIAMSLDQASLIWNMAYALASTSPKFKRFLRDDKTMTSPFPVMVIGSQNGQLESQFWARSTAKKARYLLGHTFNRIAYDEAAFDKDGEEIRSDVLLSRISDNAGKLEYTSSPNGKNWFFRQCMRSVEDPAGFFWMKGSIWQNRFISQDDFKKNMQTMRPEQIKQDIEGDFADSSSVFSTDAVSECYANQEWAALMPLKPNYVVEQDDRPGVGLIPKLVKDQNGRRYVGGVDFGRKRDKTAILVLDVTDLAKNQDGELVGTAPIVLCDQIGKTSWRTIKEKVKGIAKQYNDCPFLGDETGMGDPIIQDLQEAFGVNIEGFHFSAPSKTNLLVGLQTVIQNRQLAFPYIKDLVDQLIYYDWEDRLLTTDLVMGLALAVECAKRKVVGSTALYLPNTSVAPVALFGDDDVEDHEYAEFMNFLARHGTKRD